MRESRLLLSTVVSLLVAATISPTCHAFAPKAFFSKVSKPTRLYEAETTVAAEAVNEETTPSFRIEESDDGPANAKVRTLTIDLGHGLDPIEIETGKIGRQAGAAVTVKRGETVLYATAARDAEPKSDLGFLPLSVEYQERFSSAGTTSGAFSKRDGRPAEHEVLTCRLIDRPIRPLVANGWRHETQLLTWVLSYDGERSCDPLAITASAAALYLSDIPLNKPIAAAMVGYVDGEYLLNPSNDVMEKSRLNLCVAGTKDAVLMIEGAADFLTEEEMIGAIKFGHEAIKTICEGVAALGEKLGVEKLLSTIAPPVEGLQQRVDELFTERVDDMYGLKADKDAMGEVMSGLSKAVVERLEEEFPDEKLAIEAAFKDLLCRRMFHQVKDKGIRCDGRSPTEIRTIDAAAGWLPRVHGSALFTRGETQAIATVTLGDSGMKQKIDKIDGMEAKRFYLQYTFPPSCVGETGRIGAPGRREIGHGNLAERALFPTLPDEDTFPYSIRVESLITESHGSSSMASVCGGSLAMMDAGIPVKKPIAGVAMGMLLGDKDGISDENAIILSDILGTEDALGTMDFKVAGDTEGITTFQLDIKCEGLTFETMERALAQAKEGRLHILGEMAKVLDAPRTELAPTVPRMLSFMINPALKGKIIGAGGKQVRTIIEDFELSGLEADDQTGRVEISGFDTEKMEKAKQFIMDILKEYETRPALPPYDGPPPEVGKIYTGKITGIHDYGCFVELIPGPEDQSTGGFEALCHVSDLAIEKVRRCEGYVKAVIKSDSMDVMYLGEVDGGKSRCSRKAVLQARNNPLGENTNLTEINFKIDDPSRNKGKIVGRGGKTIRQIIDTHELASIAVDDVTGEVTIVGGDEDRMEEAKNFIIGLVNDQTGQGKNKYTGTPPEKGKIYEGKIVGVHKFGCFVELIAGSDEGSHGFDALCHVSELDVSRTESTKAFVDELNSDTIEVLYIGPDDRGRPNCSRKRALQAMAEDPSIPIVWRSEKESDAIAEAIESV